jgi:hypothetical protein
MLKDTIVVLDFAAICFLPESFIAYALRMPVHNFTREVAKYVDYPQSTNVNAMVAASGFLTLYGTSKIGQPDGFCFLDYLDHLDSTSDECPPAHATLTHYCSSVICPYLLVLAFSFLSLAE